MFLNRSLQLLLVVTHKDTSGGFLKVVRGHLGGLAMRKRPYVAVITLLVVLALTVSGCGSGTRPTPSKAAPQGPSVKEPAPPNQPQPSQPSPAQSSGQTATPQPTNPSTVTGNLKVHFIDVGQGDSILLQLPGAKTMLTDAGEASQASTIVSYLKAQGVKTIDYLIATHPHADHIGGMVAVLDAFPVKDVFMPRTGHTTTTYENLLLKLKEKGLTVTEAKAGVSVFEASNLSAAFIAPHGSRYDDINDWSAVLRLRYGDIIFLLTGDSGEKSEGEMLLSSVVSPKADVLKVGHHGSNSSTTGQFLQIVAPKYAVISCGAGNSYGHPHKDTLARLAALKVEVYRTDLHGTVVFITDGKNIEVKTGKSGQASTSKSAPAVVAPAPMPPPPSEQKTVTVYVTKSGKKYHQDSCRYLGESKMPISLEDAKSRGYGPCSVCKPLN